MNYKMRICRNCGKSFQPIASCQPYCCFACRFWYHVDSSLPNVCWHWKGKTLKDGYGKITVNYKTHRTHRIAWQLMYGKIPAELYVLHSCDNPLCVNPKHLFLGTNEENMRDMVEKSRQSATLTPYQVLEIRKRRDKGESTASLATAFDVQQSAISKVSLGRRWKHI